MVDRVITLDRKVVVSGSELLLPVLREAQNARDAVKPLYGEGDPATDLGIDGSWYRDMADPSAPIEWFKEGETWTRRGSLRGFTGPANATYPSVAGITDAEITNLSAIRADGQGGLYTYVEGDFTGQVDGNVVVASSKVAVTTGAWVLTTGAYVPAWDGFEKLIVPDAYRRITTGSFYADQNTGGATYRIDPDQASTTSTAWRKRSRNGRWFILSEPTPDLYQLGIRGTGDETDAFKAAVLYLQDAREVIVPAGLIVTYSSDVRILGNSWTLRGLGRLLGTNNARLIVGDSNLGGAGGEASGHKVLGPKLVGLSIKPADNHNGPCLQIDFADYLEVVNCDIGPYDMTDGVSYCSGIKNYYVQWATYLDNVINVNGRCIEFILTNINHNQNENHINIARNKLHVGKPIATSGANASIARAGISITVDASRDAYAAIQNFNADGNHFYRNQAGLVSGLLIDSPTSREVAALRHGNFTGNFFENIQRCYDFATAVNGLEASSISCRGNKYLNIGDEDANQNKIPGTGWVYFGNNTFALNIAIDSEDGEQGDEVATGCRLKLGVNNNFASFNGIGDTYPGFHRWSDKERGASLSVGGTSYCLKGLGSVAVASGATSVTVSHGLTKMDYQGKVPDTAIYAATCEGWAGNAYVSSVDRSAGTVTFSFTAPSSNQILSWQAEIPEE